MDFGASIYNPLVQAGADSGGAGGGIIRGAMLGQQMKEQKEEMAMRKEKLQLDEAERANRLKLDKEKLQATILAATGDGQRLAQGKARILMEAATGERIAGNYGAYNKLSGEALKLMGYKAIDTSAEREALLGFEKEISALQDPRVNAKRTPGQRYLAYTDLKSKLGKEGLNLSRHQYKMATQRMEDIGTHFPKPQIAPEVQNILQARYPDSHYLELSADQIKDASITSHMLKKIAPASESTALKIAEKDAAIQKTRNTLEKMAEFTVDPRTGERTITGIKPEYKEYFGPVDSFLTKLQVDFGGNIKAAGIQSEIKSLKKELYKITGRQLAVQEMETMIDSFLPQMSQKGTTAMVVLNNMVKMLENEQSRFKKNLALSGHLINYTPEALNKIWSGSTIRPDFGGGTTKGVATPPKGANIIRYNASGQRVK